LEAVRDHAFWRKNFHPEDDVVIQEADKQQSSYKKASTTLRKEMFTLLSELKAGVPFLARGYIGHMLSDIFLPGIIGYFTAMLYNPNNVTSEVSPVTAGLELEVTFDLARLVGYLNYKQMNSAKSKLQQEKRALPCWGHISSGGIIANFEALWVARN